MLYSTVASDGQRLYSIVACFIAVCYRTTKRELWRVYIIVAAVCCALTRACVTNSFCIFAQGAWVREVFCHDWPQRTSGE